MADGTATVGRKAFPLILWQGGIDKRFPGCPKSIPWGVISPHGKQAMRNHAQTLEQLAARGGLSPLEAMCVIKGRRLPFGAAEGEFERLEAEAVAFVAGLAATEAGPS